MTTVKTVIDFFRNKADNGQGVDKDGVHGFQCIDEPTYTAKHWFGVDLWGNAIDLLDSAKKAGWEVVYRSSGQMPKPGAFFVMDYVAGGVNYGHTGLIISDVAGGVVQTIEQNLAGNLYVGSPAQYHKRSVSSLKGWFYPPYKKEAAVKGTYPTKTVNGDLYSGLITDVDPNIMNSDSNRAKIDRIVIHHNAGTNDAGARRTWYVSTGIGTSAHYQITPDKIWGCISEQSVAYHAGDYGMNRRSIGLEHLNNSGAPHWTIAEATYQNSAKLIADICGRYGIPIDDKHIIPHKAVSATACPGGIDLAKLIRMAKEIASGGTVAKSAPTDSSAISKMETAGEFRVQVIAGGLRIRQGAGLGHRAVGTAPRGVYTITATKDADGHTWGKLKSGAGWIALTYAKKI